MDTTFIEEEPKQMDKSYGKLLHNWVGGIMHITVKTRYDLQYLTNLTQWIQEYTNRILFT